MPFCGDAELLSLGDGLLWLVSLCGDADLSFDEVLPLRESCKIFSFLDLASDVFKPFCGDPDLSFDELMSLCDGLF